MAIFLNHFMEKVIISRIFLFFCLFTSVFYTVKPALAVEDFIEKNELMSVDVQKVKIRAILEQVAMFSDKNIVISDGVSGRMNLKMSDTSGSDIIDHIVKTQGLHRSQMQNIIIINTPTEYETHQKLSHLSDSMLLADNTIKTINNKLMPLDLVFYCKTTNKTILQLVKYGDLFSFQFGKFFGTQTILIQTERNHIKTEKNKLFNFKTKNDTFELSKKDLVVSSNESNRMNTYRCDGTTDYLNSNYSK